MGAGKGKGMAYDYTIERAELFTDEGQRTFIEFWERCLGKLKLSGEVRMQEIMGSGSSWTQLACADRMIELGRIREITGNDVWGQNRVFVLNE